MAQRIYKSNTDKVIDGVCGGIADYLEIDSVWVRLAWVAAAVFLHAGGILGYLIAAIIIPRRPEDDVFYREHRETNSGRTTLFLGLILVVLGVLFLLNNFNLIPWTVFQVWLYLKKLVLPGLLIVMGIYLLSQRNRKS